MLPALPLLPEVDDITIRFETTVLELVRTNVDGARARRTFATHYYDALTAFLLSLSILEHYDDVAPEQRAEWLRHRRDRRRRLDLIGSRLPCELHYQIVAAVAFGGQA